MATDQIWDEMVKTERYRQDARWGFKPRSMERLYTILGEEFGEVGTAIIQRTNIVEELVQLAAICRLMWETGEEFGYKTEKGEIPENIKQERDDG